VRKRVDGSKLRAAREAKGMSRRLLAQAVSAELGITVQAFNIRDWESERCTPPEFVVSAIARVIRRVAAKAKRTPQ
jgi:ribosome-binding protein aMBF1 (putative translation factor)